MWYSAETPSWLFFTNSTFPMTLKGTPTTYGETVIKITATEYKYGGSVTMTFTLVAGLKPNTPPEISNQIGDQIAYRQQLFYIKIDANTFTDADGDDLVYLVSLSDGSYLPEWLT